ncbi:vacuolar alkaline phosphatase [Microbotryomycetes sp. JL221]|nr:vacuolar alkaline phosphatase [Microbotryomycetes sp. JL221]
MARPPDDPLQFVVDEDDTSDSSHTESLLGTTTTQQRRMQQDPPVRSREYDYYQDDEKLSTLYDASEGVEMSQRRTRTDSTDDDDRPHRHSYDDDNDRQTRQQQQQQQHSIIHVPTRQEIERALSDPTRRSKRPTHVGMVVVGIVSLFVIAWLTTTLLSLGTRFGRTGPRIQVILMISDGMGPASQTMSREFLQFLHDQIDNQESRKNKLNASSIWNKLDEGFQRDGFGMTPLDDMLIGASRTRSSSSLITATAFACGIKTYNGGIAVNPQDKKPCGTILEAAKRQGFATGLVATSRITHATPASFYAHVVDRDLESEIATFLIGNGPKSQVVDFALGGGECFFLPNSTIGDKGTSCRTDDQDLFDQAIKNGYTVLRGPRELREWHDKAGHEGSPVIGLFASDHMHYEIDRQQIEHVNEEQPSLREMTSHALQYLRAAGDGGKGFFLMIEGSRIDMAAHNNDPIGHLSDMLAYHDTVRFVKEWVDNANEEGTPTLLISVSDHETGGLSLGRQLTSDYPEYVWYPDVLANATHSTAFLGNLIANATSVTRSWIRQEIYEKGLGITDITDGEINELWPYRYDAYRANRVLADAISRRAQVGWSTAGHSGVDVNLYAYGINATGIAGNRENTDIGEHIAHMMGLNLDVVTLELNKNLGWHHTTLGNSSSSPTVRTHVAHYHGDF